MSYLDKIPDQAVKELVEKSVASYPKNWKHQVCAFALINKKEKKVYGPLTGTVCHAQLAYGDRDNHLVVNAHKTAWAKKNSEFLLWAVQESPFSHGILNRDEEDEIKKRASVIDVDLVGKGGALWLCKALRHFEEDTYKTRLWSQFRNEGLNGLQAFIGSDILMPSGKPSWFNSHVSLFAYSTPTNIRKYYDEFKKIEKIKSGDASRSKNGSVPNKRREWGSLASRLVRVSDGWGGYTDVSKPCDIKEYTSLLKEIFEGDPENVGKD